MALKTLTTADLEAELKRRKRGDAKLEKRRAKLLAELEIVERELAFLGGKSTRRGRVARSPRTRARNEVSLPDAIAMAMEVRAVVSPKEAAELVLKNGFKTTSKNFGMMVSNALSKDVRFKRIGRGQYERVK